MNEDMNIDNYKMAIIPSAGHDKLEEGKLFKYGPFMFYIYHDVTFRDFCKKYYPEIINHPNIKQDSPAELYAYYLQLQGNIVIANTTHASTVDKDGKTAMFFMPEKTSKIQKESLELLIENIEDYNVAILYDFYLKDNYPQGENIIQKVGESPSEVFNQYFSLKSQTRKK